jgi:hypothetical protein
VEACYSGNEFWYEATITQVTHWGYPTATYTVHFTQYDVYEPKSWKQIRLKHEHQNDMSASNHDLDSKQANAPESESSDAASSLVALGTIPLALNPIATSRAETKQGSWRARARGR